MRETSRAIDEARLCRADAARCLAELRTTVAPEKRRELLGRMGEFQDRAAEFEREARRVGRSCTRLEGSRGAPGSSG
jgi:hypothetical protein